MLSFYLIAGGLALVAAIVIVRPLIAGRGEADNRDARDATVFRDQLAEVERDLARGTITPEEAEGARIEVSRRLIAADQRARHRGVTGPAPQGHSGLVAGLALVGTPALAAALYLGLGEPGVPDQPLASRPAALAGVGGGTGGAAAMRPGQSEAEAAMAGQQQPPAQPDPEYAAMAEQLETTLADRPNDVQGHKLLANTLMNLGRYAEAWRTYDKVIELSGGTVDAETRGAKAEGMILAAGGYVSPEAEAEIARALQLDPSLPIARYYGGLALGQAGRLDEAIAMWQALRRDSPPDAPYLPWLDRMMADAMQARGGAGDQNGGGVSIPGPSSEDIAAAEQLTPEQRAAMVEGMVARLDERLTRQGGTAQEWVQLIASYATLGRADEARDAYGRAMAALDQAGVETVRAQAARLGVADPAETGPTTTQSDPAAAAPQSPVGPTQADIAAANQMSPEDRAAMVDGMVARLDDRLTRQGGTAEEWGRLMASYATLGRMEAAADAYARALAALGDGPEADAVRTQAARLGFAAGAPTGAAAPTGPAPAPAAPQTSTGPTSPGPSAADIAAAAQMSPDDRAAMVRGMVARLEARLTGEGGSAEEWLRLIDSYMKLDQPQEAARAYRLAAEALQGDPGAGAVKEQALLMGVPIE